MLLFIGILGVSLFVVLIYLAIGALIGWLAGLIMKGEGFGCVGNIGIAIVGSILGGFVFRRILGIEIGSFITSVLGAILLLFIVRLIKGKK